MKTDNLFELIALLAIVANGKHLDDVNLEYIKTSKIEIEALGGQKILLNLDGEYGGDAPVQFDNLKGHLDMYVNLDEINDNHYLGDEETLALEAVAQKFAEEANKIKDEDEED